MGARLIGIATLAATLLQAQTVGPIRLGVGAQSLTEQDIAVFQRALPGSTLWLVEGKAPFPGLSIAVYFAAEKTTAELRRGQMIRGKRPVNPPGAWKLDARGNWAQVAIAGRDYNVLNGESDFNLPFQVDGDFSDEELITLIAFIRTTVASGGRNGGVGSLNAFPILQVIRTSKDTVKFFLAGGNGPSQAVFATREGQGWRVTSITFVSPD
jgi:hypothetical protein